MLTGNRSRRTARRFALGMVIAMTAGCGHMAAHRVDPGPISRGLPGPVAIEPVPASSSEPTPPPAIADLPALPTVPTVDDAEPPASTPMLDAGLSRASALRRSIVEEVARPEPPPFDKPPEPEPAPPSTPAGPSPEPSRRDEPRPGPEPATESGKPEPPDGNGQGESVLRTVLSALAAPGPSTVAGGESPLEILELKPCRRVLGFGDVEPWQSPQFRPGQTLILYCEMGGVGHEPEGDGFRSRLAATIELIPEGRDVPAWKDTLGTAEETCRRRRRDYYVSYRITLPPTLAPGPYRLRLIQDDRIAGRSASREIPMAIGR